MADKIQILIESILSKGSKQKLEQELKKIESQLKPLDLKLGISDEAQIKLFKSMQKIEKQKAKMNADQDKASAKAIADNETQLQYEQKVRMALEKEEQSQKNITLEIQKQLALYKQQLAIRNQNLKTTYGKSYDSAGMSNILNTANGLNASDFKTVDALKNTTKQLDLQIDKSTAGMRQLRREATLAMKESDGFMTTLAKDFGKMVAWTITGTALFGSLRQLKQGLETLKEIDSLMVEIAKVTDLSADAMERLKNNSFDAASAFGRTAQDYLKATAEFSRAGYGEQAQELSKLSLLAQNVGELTGEQANQFLLATDAAYKYSGSQKELGKVLDGVNQIDNRFATSIQKVSQGMTVAGSIASNASVDVSELASAIGVMTAVTQRSGNEAGRAFRSILMNIRQVKGETEDGEVIDDEALSKSAKALDAVGIKVHELKDGMEVLRNPMEVLRDLSNIWESLGKGSLKQAAIIDALGGKFRGNQLVALVENWSMYEKMLTEFANSVGSAMSENEKRMSSLQTKINQLTNATSKMWNNAISTDFMKFVVDASTAIIQLTDRIGLLPTVITAAAIALILFNKTFLAGFIQNVAVSAASLLTTLGIKFGIVTASATTATGAITALSTAIGFLAPLAVIAGVYGLVKVMDMLNITMKEYQQQVNESYANSQSNIARIKELSDEYETLAKKTDLTREEKLKLVDIERELNTKFAKTTESIDFQNNSLDTNIKKIEELTRKEAERFQILNKTAYEKAKKTLDVDVAYNVGMPTGDRPFKNIEDAIAHFEKVVKNSNNSNSASYIQARETLQKLYDEYDAGTDIILKYEGYEKLLGKTVEETNSKLEEPFVPQQIKNFDELSKSVKTTITDIKDLNDIQDDLNKGQTLTSDSMVDLINKYPELLDYIHKTADGYTIEAEGINLVRQGLIDKKIVALETESGITQIMKEQLSLRLGISLLELESIKTLNDARKMASGLTSSKGISSVSDWVEQNKKDTAMLESVAKLNALKDMLLSGGLKRSETKKGSDPSPIPYQDVSSELIKTYNTQVEIDKVEAKSLDKQIKTAESAKDYAKSLELQNKLLDNQKKTVEDLKASNDKIHESANAIRAGTSFDTTSWFDSFGNATQTYLDLLKSFEGKIDSTSKRELDNIKKIFGDLQKLKQAWYDNADAIGVMNDTMESSQQKLDDLYKTMREARISIEEDILEALKDIYKEEYEAKKKSIQDKYDLEIDNLNRLKELNSRNRDEQKYVDEQKERNDELVKLQTRYNKLLRDPTSEKERVELAKKISDLMKEIKDTEIDQNLQREADSIDDLVKLKQEEKDRVLAEEQDKFEEIIADASNFNDQLQDVMNSGQQGILAFLMENSKKFKEAGMAQGQALLDGWTEKLRLLELEHDLSQTKILNELDNLKTAFEKLGIDTSFIGKLEQDIESGKVKISKQLAEWVHDLNAATIVLAAKVEYGNATNEAGRKAANAKAIAARASMYDQEFAASIGDDVALPTATENVSNYTVIPANTPKPKTTPAPASKETGFSENWSDKYFEAKAKGDWKGMEAANKAANKERGLGEKVTATEDIKAIRGYDTGGIDSVGGAAILHGRKNAVETIFNAEQGKKLFDFVNNLPQTYNIDNIVRSLGSKSNVAALAGGGGSISNSYTFGDINLNVQKISDDLDIKSVGRQIVDEVYNQAKSIGSVNGIRRR